MISRGTCFPFGHCSTIPRFLVDMEDLGSVFLRTFRQVVSHLNFFHVYASLSRFLYMYVITYQPQGILGSFLHPIVIGINMEVQLEVICPKGWKLMPIVYQPTPRKGTSLDTHLVARQSSLHTHLGS